MPPWCKIQVYLLCRSKTCLKQVSKGLKYIKCTTHWAQKSGLTLTFEHVTWKSIGIIYSLKAPPAPNLLLIYWRGQRYWSDNTVGWEEWFDLDFEHVTWKSIGIIYSLRATPAPSLIVIKWKDQKILSRQHLVYRPMDRPSDSCKTICPLFQGGHKKSLIGQTTHLNHESRHLTS